MSGTYFAPIRNDYLDLSGGTITGSTYISANLSADTYYSGSTDLITIIKGVDEITKNKTIIQSLSGGSNTVNHNCNGKLNTLSVFSSTEDYIPCEWNNTDVNYAVITSYVTVTDAIIRITY